MAAALLLGSVENAAHGRIGPAVTLAAAWIIAYNDPTQDSGAFLITPGLFAIAWRAERKREENARRAVFAERVRIARELHDVVAHHVSMMGVQATAARVVIDRDPGKAKTAPSAIETSSRQAVAELQRLLGFLRQDGDANGLAPQPGRRQLERLVASMSDTQLGVDLTVEGDIRALPQIGGRVRLPALLARRA
jgi:signal transduction histidine kinase